MTEVRVLIFDTDDQGRIGLIYSPYEARDDIKDFSGNRRWNPQQRCWVTRHPERMIQWLRRRGWNVTVTAENGSTRQEQRTHAPPPWEPPPSSPSAQPADHTKWMRTIHRALPNDRLRKVVFRALVRELHPDSGGSEEMTKTLIDVFQGVK